MDCIDILFLLRLLQRSLMIYEKKKEGKIYEKI